MGPPLPNSVNHPGVLSWLTSLFCWYDLETIHLPGPLKLPCISIILATNGKYIKLNECLIRLHGQGVRRSNSEIWLARMDLIDEVRARFGSLQRPRNPDPEGLGGKGFNHEGHCRISLPGCGLLVGCCTHRGEGLLTAFWGWAEGRWRGGTGKDPSSNHSQKAVLCCFPVTVVQ